MSKTALDRVSLVLAASKRRQFNCATLRLVPDSPGVYLFWSKARACIYVGMTDRTLPERLWEHYKDVNSSPLLQLWVRSSYGVLFEFIVLNGTREQIRSTELALIDRLSPFANKEGKN